MHKRQLGPDVVRVAAILGVVYIHADSITISLTNYLGGVSWWLAAFFQSLARVSVPLFVMLSGYLWLALKKHTPTFKEIIFRSSTRIMLPLITWSGFYFFWEGYWKHSYHSFDQIFLRFLKADSFHLYFLYIILGLYLFLPIIKKIWRRLNLKNKGQISLWLLAISASWLSLSYFVWQTYASLNGITFFLPYVGYFLLGSLARSINFSRAKLILSGLSLIFLSVVTTLSYYTHVQDFVRGDRLFWTDATGYFFWEHFSPNVILMSVLAFWFLINLDQYAPMLRSSFLAKLIKRVSIASYGIYLVHPLVQDLVEHYLNYAVHLIEGNLWWYLVKKIAIVFSLSLFFVLGGRKLPIVKLILFGEK